MLLEIKCLVFCRARRYEVRYHFLFSVVMTCVLFDADKKMEECFGSLRALVSLTRSLLYADDTFIIEASAGNA